MSAAPSIQGIAGLAGNEPIGAAVTIGVKDKARGFPTERDRFHIVEVNQDAEGRRPHHRAFAFFNQLPPEKRRLLRGNLVHANRAECFEHHLKAQVGKGAAHPQKRPFCIGNGVTAVRWMGGAPDNFKDIECPHDRCEYRVAQGNKPSPCKPWMRLVFRLTWDDATQAALAAKGHPALPSMTVKFTSGSWNTTRAVLGFFEQFERTAASLGIPGAKLFGLPFTMQLSEKTNSERQSRFPVVSLSPSMDLIEFLMAQREQLNALGASIPRHEALTDESQQDSVVVAGDAEVISAGVPGC